MRFLWALPVLLLFFSLVSSADSEEDVTFKFQVVDVTIGQEAGIHLFMQTEQSYPCVNYAIPAVIDIAAYEISIDLADPKEPNICFTIVNPAFLREPLNVVDGTYALRLNYGGRSDAYILTIKPEEIDLTPITPAFSMCSTSLTQLNLQYVSERSFTCLDTITPSPTLAPSPSPTSTSAPSAAPSTPGAFPATGGAPPPASSSGSALALLALTLLAGTVVASFAAARRVP